MTSFTSLLPLPDQTNITRTSVISFTILVDEYGAQINTLNAVIDGTTAIYNGTFTNGYVGTILPSANKYVVGIYPKAPKFLKSAHKVDVELEILDAYGSPNTQNYSFYTTGYSADAENLTSETSTNICNKEPPQFPPTDVGLMSVINTGVGTEIELNWRQAVPSSHNSLVFYNIYYSSVKDGVFDFKPEFITEGLGATIGGLPPGETFYFAVRATEFDINDFTTDGLKQAGESMYFYPFTSLLNSVDSYDTSIPVNSIEGFPDFGVVAIGSELIKYSGLQQIPPALITSTSLRGYGGTIASDHQENEEVILYKGKEDPNTNILQQTPSFQKPNWPVTWVKIDGYGNDGFRDGYDGYDAYYDGGMYAIANYYDGYDGYYKARDTKYDIATRSSDSNDALGTFRRFDYCGTYRVNSPESFMRGQCIGSYFGGIQLINGNRVKLNNLQTHMLQREELLLSSTGEPFVLLRRMWSGLRCLCLDYRREHPDAKCPVCFRTSYVQGYNQFFNPRRPDRRILIRVEPAPDDLTLMERGFDPNEEPNAWTLPFPNIKDRDILVRFTPDGIEDFRYEVLSVERNRTFFANSGVQKLRLKRLAKSEIIYQFPIVRNIDPVPNSHTTSVSSGEGIRAHSHQIVLPTGANLSTFKGATLPAEGHNHIIYNGTLYSVFNHTHTL